MDWKRIITTLLAIAALALIWATPAWEQTVVGGIDPSAETVTTWGIFGWLEVVETGVSVDDLGIAHADSALVDRKVRLQGTLLSSLASALVLVLTWVMYRRLAAQHGVATDDAARRR